MAAIPAANITLYKEMDFGGKRAKAYKIVSDGSGVTAAIAPGVGFGRPWGNYTGYVRSGGTYTLTVPAGTSGSSRYCVMLGL